MSIPFFQRLAQLQRPVRSLLFLYLIFGFTYTLVEAFMQIKVFKMFPDLSTNIMAMMFLYTGITVAFCGFGYIASRFGLGSKQGFYYSFLSFALSLIIIGQAETVFTACLGMFIHGLGSGFFWLTVHTYELTETKDHERDFYSSVLESGRQITMILAPLTATLLIWLSVSVFDLSTFTLLFAVAPLFYLLGLFCFGGIREYYPEKIELADVTHFVLEKRNVLAQMYLAGSGAQHILAQTLIPLTIFYIVGTELRVGAYATAAGVLSVMAALVLSRYRHEGNRVLLYGLSATGIAFLLAFLGYNMTFQALLLFSLLGVIIQPIMNVSDHVISLKTMENIGRSKKDFYATMILRDFSFWVWRMVAGLVVIFIARIFETPAERLSVGLYVLAFATFLSFVGAKLLVSRMKLGEIR